MESVYEVSRLKWLIVASFLQKAVVLRYRGSKTGMDGFGNVLLEARLIGKRIM